ncbi:hypothetical protein [Solibaculum mannosilyticum]|uniref:Uncharacterized protein n=1 Tax=Solibaculum mannosilyticum TaxID=2780922 RepID=A0A7I8D3N7_9FIRM|nr:hypothetical protein [Solibaculum mannosilyticum]BCI60615.1 hypothetical protein C12CBH8_12540 [Solibaculum mannosilyticum]
MPHKIDEFEFSSIEQDFTELSQVLINTGNEMSNFSEQLQEDINFEADRKIKHMENISKMEKHLSSINSNVNGIKSEVQTEREERKDADERNMRYTKRWNRITLMVSLLAIAIALSSFLCQFFGFDLH